MPCPAVWLSEPEPTIGFRGLAALATEAGHRVEVLEDSTPSPGDLVVSDPSRSPGGPPTRLKHCHHLALTHRRDEPFVLRCLRAGYLGFLLHTTPSSEVAAALPRLAAGDAVVASALASRVALSGARLADDSFWPGVTRGLTRRESEVLEGLSHGQSTRQVAESLFVGEETVRSHLKSLYHKLGVGDRSAAVAHAFREGILAPDAD